MDGWNVQEGWGVICSVVLRPTDPLDNASTEVSNLTLPQNSPSYLFHPFRLPIRFLDSTIARSGIIFRPSPIIRHRFRPVRRGKITNSKYLILPPSNNFIGIETWPGKEGIRARRVVFPIAKVGDRWPRSIVEILGSRPSNPRQARSQFS